jgi:Ni/Co efflux regulator RcnB
MKRFLITAAALSLVAAPAAFAQQQNQNSHDDHHPSGGQGAHQSGNGGQHQGGRPSGGPGVGTSSGGGRSFGPAPQGQPTNHGVAPGAGGGSGGQWRAGAVQGHGAPPGPANQSRGSFQRNLNASHRFSAPVFRWPQGLGYRRYVYGQFLPPVFLTQNYWLYDYANYDLPYPPPGTFWVRYGPDALLVDRHTGEVVQVVYGVFY